jgi:DNA repair protein RadD
MIQLRDYQSRTLAKLWDWFRANPEGNPVIEAVVGAGKSIMLAEAIRQALAWPGTRVLMCVGSRELCRQNVEKLLHLWPEAPVGIYSAGLKSKQLGTQILYATIGSVYRRWHELGHIDLLMVDECHQISAKDQGMYRDLIRHLLTVCPRVRVIGWTGTAFHGTGTWLHDAEQPLFTDIAARVTMRELLDAGYLAPLRTPTTTTRLSAEGVKMQGGDYIVRDLARALDQQDLVAACADELVVLGADRQRWLVYGVTVAHAHHIADAFKARGIACAVISAQTPHPKRDASLALLQQGRLRALVNVATLTTGIDIPEVDLLCLMRNTRSPVLFTQICGRGMRTAPGKLDCLLIDFTDTLMALGPVDLIKGKARSKKERGEAPFKICDTCGTRNSASARVCLECGTEFEIDETPRHGRQASDAPALSSDLAPRLERHAVAGVDYHYWSGRDGKLPTLKVTYRGALMRIASEWICFEHQGYPRTKAVTWLATRAPGSKIPATVDEAEQRAPAELRAPLAVVVNTRPKYPEVVGYEWDARAQVA